jgi:putative membrane protein
MRHALPVLAQYSDRRSTFPAAPTVLPALAWTAAAIGIVGQIAYPLGNSATRTMLTGVTVVAFFAAMVAASCNTAGVRRTLAVVAVSCGFAWCVELVGVQTGLPFGRYSYTGTLAPTVAGVPVIVPMAWTAMGLAALALGRRLAPGPTRYRVLPLTTVSLANRIRLRLGGGTLDEFLDVVLLPPRVPIALVGGGALASWDLFLDPQMVGAGNWYWHSPQWTIPGIGGIPASNFAGWLVVSVLLVGLLDRVLPADPPIFEPERPFGGSTAATVAATVYLWTYGSELLAWIAFFHRVSVAAVGGVVMGAFALPYARALWLSR